MRFDSSAALLPTEQQGENFTWKVGNEIYFCFG
jgi:hypothetical protein